MKIQNILRRQAAVIGFAGMLFVASSAPAQEITNTVWPDAPGATTSVVEPAAPVASDARSLGTSSGSPNTSAAVAEQPIASQKAAISDWPAVETWAIACLLVFVAMVGLYRRAAARQINRNLESRIRQVRDRVAIS